MMSAAVESVGPTGEKALSDRVPTGVGIHIHRKSGL
jgi:hypothetical protein